MIDNDQSTIIEARYINISPSPLTLPPTYQQQTTECTRNFFLTLTPSLDMLWSILLNQTFRISIHTKYCKFDCSEMIFGPYEKMTFYGEHPMIPTPTTSTLRSQMMQNQM
jgi:hypothetical protein